MSWRSSIRRLKKYNQCIEYCQQNSEDLAVIQLKQVIAAHPTFLRAHQLLALLYLHDDQYAKAKQVLRAARKLDTNNETTLRVPPRTDKAAYPERAPRYFGGGTEKEERRRGVQPGQ